MRANQWDGLAIGDVVRSADPDVFISDVARRLRDREGSIVSLRPFSGAPIVLFPKIGRRKEFKWLPSYRTDILVVGMSA